VSGDAFARAFLSRCAAAGLDDAGIKRAVDDAAAYDADAGAELRAHLEKSAAPWGQMLTGARAAIGKYAPQAFSGARRALSHPTVGRQIAPTAGGAVAGAFGGQDVFGDRGIVEGPFGMRLSAPGAIAGAAAFNPRLRRMAGRSAIGNTPMQAMRGAITGSVAGAGADMAAGHLGYDTNFGRIGAMAGGAMGTARGALGTAASRLPNGPARAMAAQGARGLGDAMGGVQQFGQGTFDPITGVPSYLGRAGWTYLRRGGAAARATPFMPGATTAAQRAGRVVGGAGLAGLGLGVGGAALDNQIGGTVDRHVGRVYQDVVPSLAADADRYMMSRGMLDETGRMNPLGMLLNSAGGHLGQLGHSLAGAGRTFMDSLRGGQGASPYVPGLADAQRAGMIPPQG
jgi:hypothetical protein